MEKRNKILKVILNVIKYGITLWLGYLEGSNHVISSVM